MMTSDHHLDLFQQGLVPDIDGRRFVSSGHAHSWRQWIARLHMHGIPKTSITKYQAMVGLHIKDTPFSPVGVAERHVSIEYFHNFLQGCAKYLVQEIHIQRDSWDRLEARGGFLGIGAF